MVLIPLLRENDTIYKFRIPIPTAPTVMADNFKNFLRLIFISVPPSLKTDPGLNQWHKNPP